MQSAAERTGCLRALPPIKMSSPARGSCREVGALHIESEIRPPRPPWRSTAQQEIAGPLPIVTAAEPLLLDVLRAGRDHAQRVRRRCGRRRAVKPVPSIVPHGDRGCASAARDAPGHLLVATPETTAVNVCVAPGATLAGLGGPLRSPSPPEPTMIASDAALVGSAAGVAVIVT